MDILKETLDSIPDSKDLELNEVLKTIPGDGDDLFQLHRQTQSLNPQQEAEYLKLSQRMELPRQTIVENYQDFKKENELPDSNFWQDYEKNHPKSAEFFKKEENHSVFRDKFEAVAAIEIATQKGGIATDILKSFASGANDVSAGLWKSGQLVGDTMEELGLTNSFSFLNPTQMKVLTGLMRIQGDKDSKRAEELRPESYTGDVVGEIQKGNVVEGGKQLTLALANNAPQMLSLMLGGAAGVGTGAAIASGLSQGGNIYAESEDSGASKGNKIVHAWGSAGVEALSEKLGTLSVFGSKSFDPMIKAMTKESRKKIIYEGLKGVGKESFSEGAEELISELYQTTSSWALDIDDNAFDGVGNRLANSFTIGAASGASMRSPIALMESKKRYMNLKNHENNLDIIQGVMDSVKDNQLDERNAGAIENLVQSSIDSNAKGVQKIYIDSDVLNQYFQNNTNLKKDEILEELGISDQVDEANTFGGDIEINTSKLARIAKTGIFDQIKEDIRFEPNQLSSKQNAELEAVISGQIDAASDTTMQEYERIKRNEDQFNMIEQEIYKKNLEAGVKNDIAKANARVFATEISTMATLENRDALEFYNEIAPQIIFAESDVDLSKKTKFSTANIVQEEVNRDQYYQVKNEEEQKFIDQEIDSMITEVLNAEVKSSLDRNDVGFQGEVTGRTYENSYPTYYRDIGAKNKAEFEKIARSKKGVRYERLKNAAIDRLVNGWSNNSIGHDLPNNIFRDARNLDLVLEAGSIVKGKVISLNTNEGMIELPSGETVYFDRSVAQKEVNIGDDVTIELAENPDFFEANSLYQFAGPKAKNADMVELNKARLMERDGIDFETIRKETGWFKAPDNKWRFEIDDSKASFKEINLNKKKKYKLSDVIEHHELFEAYPSLRDMSVEFAAFRGRKGGHFDRKNKTLKIMVKQDEKYPASYKKAVERLKEMKQMPAYAELMGAKQVRDYDNYRRLLNDTEFGREYQIHNSEVLLTKPEKSYPRDINADKEALNVVLHEVQHAIQNIEGFSRGGNKKQDGGYQNYLNLHGEQEARDTEARKNLDGEQRKGITPALLIEKNKDKAIIKWDNVEIEQELPSLEEIENQFKINEKGQLYFQNEAEPQGRFDVLKDGQTIIRMFKSANSSTFLHESGHFWLNHIQSRIQSGMANEAQVKMWEKISNFLEITDSNEISIEQHEKFARAREQYFREGKAPVKGLKDVFRKFSKWLKTIYKTAKELDVEITPEIREFMDSLLQSEVLVSQAINEAGLDIGSLKDLSPEELTPEVRLRLDELQSKSIEMAEEKLVRKQLKAMSADRKKAVIDAVNNKRKEITEEVKNSDYALFLEGIESALEVKDIRAHSQKLIDSQLNEAQETVFEMIAESEGFTSAAHMAKDILDHKTTKEIIDLEVNKFKSELESETSTTALASEARRIVRSEQQVEIKAIEAEILFEMINNRTEQELNRIELELEKGNNKLLIEWMEAQARHDTETRLGGKFSKKLEQVQNNADKENQKLNKKINAKDAKIEKLNEEYDRLKDRASYKLKEQKAQQFWKKALAAKDNAEAVKAFREGRDQLKSDIATLAKLESNAIQSLAKSKIEQMIIKDINPNKFYIAHRNAAIKTQSAMARGDTEAAYKAKREEMINLALAKEAMRIKREASKIESQLLKERTRKVDSYKHEDHFHQVAKILERFGFGRSKYQQPKGTLSLSEWKDKYDKEFDLYSIPVSILNESINKQRDSLSIEDLRDIKNAIKNIRELANSKNRVMSLTTGLNLDAMKTALINSAKMNTKKKKITRRGDTKADKALNMMDKYFSSLTKIDTYLQKLDGYKHNGVWHKYFKGIIDKAQDAESREKEILVNNIQSLYGNYTKQELKELSKKKFINEFGNSFMHSELIAMALNLGNESNKTKLLSKAPVAVDSSKWNEQLLMQVLQNQLNEKDWKFVQESWDLVNSYWPRVADLHRDVTGFAPGKIENTPFTVLVGNKAIRLTGGYYPLKKDFRESQIANEQEVSNDLKQEMPTYAAMTKQGHTKARVDAEYSVSLSLNVMNQHLLNVVHDLTHRKPVIDLRKILNDKEIEESLRSNIGIEGVNEIHKWLKAVANNSSVDNPNNGFYETAIKTIRKRTGAVVLLWRFGVVAQNAANTFLFSNGVEGFSHKDALSSMAKYGLASYFPSFANPKARREIENLVFSKSAFMRDKAETPEFTIADLTNKAMGLEESSKIMEMGGAMMSFTDQLTNIPIWLGAYNKQLALGKTDEQAIRFADLLVERATGSGRKADQASILRGTELEKLFSMFYSFLSVEFNRWSVESGKAQHRGEAMDFAKFAGFALQRLLVFNTVSMLLSGKLFSGDDEEEMTKTVLANTLLYPVSFFPIVRDIASLGVNMALDLDTFGYRPSPVFNSIDQLYRTGMTTKNFITGNADGKEAAESLTRMSAYIFGYPDSFNGYAWNTYDMIFEDMKPQVSDLYRRRPKKER